jgi:hypothetical protein
MEIVNYTKAVLFLRYLNICSKQKYTKVNNENIVTVIVNVIK